jgi:hypothetical protein
MNQPKFCDILAEAKQLALQDESFEVIHALDSGLPPTPKSEARIYRELIDRAFERLTQKQVA